MLSCQPKSDCFDSRVIVKQIETNVKFDKRKDFVFIDNNDTIYLACNYPDSLVRSQDYKVKLSMLQTEPNEKWIGKPCEIQEIEMLKKQRFKTFELDEKYFFLGGGGKTKKDESITHGIDITKRSATEIEYEFIELIDWRDRRELKGTAIIQPSVDDQIEIRNEVSESAFRFVDSLNRIEIYLTKSHYLGLTKSRIFEKDKTQLSGVMHLK